MRDTYPQIDKTYVETGKIRYVLLDLPLERIHKNAMGASEATYCAEDQGKYWEMHNLLFENQKSLTPWEKHATTLGLNVDDFNACMSTNKYEKRIRAYMKQASKVGITGTPGFVVAKTDPKDPTKAIGVSFLRGAQAFPAFQKQLDNALKTAK